MVSIYDLFRAFAGRCCYCGCETFIPGKQRRALVQQRFDITAGAPRSGIALRYRQATREHIRRVADGGDDSADNIALSCAFCNGHRGDATPEQHRENMVRYVAAGLHPNHPAQKPWTRRGAERERRILRSGESSTTCAEGQP